MNQDKNSLQIFVCKLGDKKMKLLVQDSEGWEAVVVPNDVYSARVVDVDEGEFEYGKTVILKFELTSGEQKGKTLNGLASAKLNPKTKLWEWITAIGCELRKDTEFDLNELKGKACRVMTKTSEQTLDDGSKLEISNVVEVLPSKSP